MGKTRQWVETDIFEDRSELEGALATLVRATDAKAFFAGVAGIRPFLHDLGVHERRVLKYLLENGDKFSPPNDEAADLVRHLKQELRSSDPESYAAPASLDPVENPIADALSLRIPAPVSLFERARSWVAQMNPFR